MNCSIRIARCSRLAVLLLVLSLKVCSVQQAFGDDEKPIRVLIGRVADKAGNPIEGATVEWGHCWAKYEDRESVKTKADGHYQLETRKYDIGFRLGVWADGWGPTWEDIVIPGTVAKPKVIDFTLHTSVSVSAQLKDMAGNTPVADARIVLGANFYKNPRLSKFNAYFPMPGPLHETRTDADGWFHVHNLPADVSDPYFHRHRPMNPARQYDYGFRVWAEPPCERMYNWGEVTPNDSEVQTAKDNSLFQANNSSSYLNMLSGHVVDENGDPIDRFFVASGSRATSCFNARGKFSFWDQNATPIIVYANGYEPWEMPNSVNGDQMLTVECRMKPVAKTSMRSAVLVDSNGTPIAGAQISYVFTPGDASEFCPNWDNLNQANGAWFTTSKVVSDSDGSFTYPPGSALAILADGFARKYLPAGTISSATGSGGSKIELQPESQLQGIVTYRGQPCANRRLYLTPVDANVIGPGIFYSDESGHFEVASLQPGRYTLSSSFANGTRAAGYHFLETQKELMLGVGPTKLHLSGYGGSLVLKGSAPPFSSIGLLQQNSRRTIAETKADVDGQYYFEGLPEGIYGMQLVIPVLIGTSHPQPVEINLKVDTVYDFKVQESAR